jgi:hypothetical protein
LRSKIDAHQPQHRLIDHPQISLHRRLGSGIAPQHRKVDRHIQHPRPLRKIHPQKKNVAPGAECVRSIRTGVFSARIGNDQSSARSLQ